MVAISHSNRALCYASAKLRGDKEVVTTAVTNCWKALECASSELRSDKEIAMVAVTIHGLALRYASIQAPSGRQGNFRWQSRTPVEHWASLVGGDKEVVTTAVTNCWIALEYASAEFCDDKDVVLAAVSQTCCAYAMRRQSFVGTLSL